MQGEVERGEDGAVFDNGLEGARLQKIQSAEVENFVLHLKVIQFAAQAVERVAQRRNTRIQKLSGGQQFQGMPGLAFEERHAEFLFQFLHLLAHGRRRKAENGGRAAYAACFGHVVEGAQVGNEVDVDVVHGGRKG